MSTVSRSDEVAGPVSDTGRFRPADGLAALRAFAGSILGRMIAFGVVVVIMGMVARLSFLLPFLERQMTELSASHQMTIAEYVAKDIEFKIKARIDFLLHLAEHIPPRLLAEPAALEEWVRERHEINPIFSSGFIVQTTGEGTVPVEYPRQGRKELDVFDRDWFIQAGAQRHPVLGKPARRRATGEPVLPLAVPVFGQDGRVIAILAGFTAIVAPGFLDLLQETKIGRTGGFLLVSPRDGVFVAATDMRKTLTALPPPGTNPLHDKAMAGYRGTGITVNIHGVDELSAIVSIPSANWFLVARVPTAEALEVMSDVRAFLLFGTWVSLVLVFFVGGSGVWYLLKPLQSNARIIRRMAKGELPLHPLPVARQDEVGNLVEGFNFLLARLDAITAEKLSAERLRLAEKECMETSLRQWMADSSHELRTPIAVLQAQIEAIQDGIRPVDSRSLGVLHRETIGLVKLINDLNTLARSDVGQIDYHFEDLDPFQALDAVVANFDSRFEAAGLTVEWNVEEQPRVVVSADAPRLRQVFANLLENSLRYTDAGGTLRVAGTVSDSRLTLYVDDTAPAVPAEALPRLFDRFFRVEESRSRERGGTGIGLAVCRSLIVAHGGQIVAMPSPLGGLRIALTLPVVEVLP